MAQIIPAIMPRKYEDLVARINEVTGLTNIIQIDVMDGKFVTGLTWPYVDPEQHFEHILEQAEGLPGWQDLDFEVDLMVAEPEKVWHKWVSAGARRIIIHQESTTDIAALIADFRSEFPKQDEIGTFDVELGIAQSIATPLADLEPYLDDVDFVQLMGIANIGKQGQPFDIRVISKIEQLRQIAPRTIISVDGGVSLETATALLDAGVDRLVVGSALFKTDDVAETFEMFKSLNNE